MAWPARSPYLTNVAPFSEATEKNQLFFELLQNIPDLNTEHRLFIASITQVTFHVVFENLEKGLRS